MGKMRNDEHRVGLEELFARIGAGPSGLGEEEAMRRRREYGPNVFEARWRQSVFVRFGRHLVNFFALLLWTGSGLAFLSERLMPGEGNLYIGVALAAVVVLNAAFTFLQEYQSERIMESFRSMMPLRVEALRDGRKTTVPASGLVPGDVVCLREGDRVPADGRLIEEHALKVDNSALTGESEPQLRKLECTHEDILESRNMVFSGTLVLSGNGTALIYGTGEDTQLGKIARLTRQTQAVASPLKREIDHFIRVISTIAIVLGVLFFFLSVLKGDRPMAGLIFAIGIIVANVPEGLLPTVTLCLSMASRRMAKKMALIKRLESVETLGSTTVICTDKTGTITENRISASTVFINMAERDANDSTLEAEAGFDRLLRVAVLCNNARLDKSGGFVGDPTEAALLRFASPYVDIQRLIAGNPRLEEHPFDSRTRRMLTVNGSGGGRAVYLKGAPEVVLEKCGRHMDGGVVLALEAEARSRIMEGYRRMASRGERVLGLASGEDGLEGEGDFVFVALLGMMDPPRKEIAGAIRRCRSAGIGVVMITGDYGITAEAIAGMVGLTGEGGADIMTGDELDAIEDEGLREFLRRENRIFARTSPVQKLRIVKTLQGMGEVVTVTGDGVNDAPALKNADMGVAMGVSGTEVAKEAADMVLLDDNFAAIVNAVEEGRTVYSNIRKFISYILTSNVPEILPFITFVVLGIPLPLTVVLILSIDLGTDLLPALGLGVETPEENVMDMPPRPRTDRLLSPGILFLSYGVFGMAQAATGFFSYFTVLYGGGWSWGQRLGPADPLYLKAVTAFFASIVVCQVADVMICRTRRESVFRKGLFSNRLVLAGVASEAALLALIVYRPVTQGFFGTCSLSLFELSLSAPFALAILLGDEARKALLRKGNRFAERYLNR